MEFLNPHIRGIKSTQSYTQLSKRTKNYYDLLTSSIKEQPCSLSSTVPIKKPSNNRFIPIDSSATLKSQRASSENRFISISRSTSKESSVLKRREFSIEEQVQMEEIIQEKLSKEFTTVKNAISDKIRKLSRHRIFAEEINTLRAETQAAVQSKIM